MDLQVGFKPVHGRLVGQDDHPEPVFKVDDAQVLVLLQALLQHRIACGYRVLGLIGVR